MAEFEGLICPFLRHFNIRYCWWFFSYSALSLPPSKPSILEFVPVVACKFHGVLFVHQIGRFIKIPYTVEFNLYFPIQPIIYLFIFISYMFIIHLILSVFQTNSIRNSISILIIVFPGSTCRHALRVAKRLFECVRNWSGCPQSNSYHLCRNRLSIKGCSPIDCWKRREDVSYVANTGLGGRRSSGVDWKALPGVLIDNRSISKDVQNLTFFSRLTLFYRYT